MLRACGAFYVFFHLELFRQCLALLRGDRLEALFRQVAHESLVLTEVVLCPDENHRHVRTVVLHLVNPFLLDVLKRGVAHDREAHEEHVRVAVAERPQAIVISLTGGVPEPEVYELAVHDHVCCVLGCGAHNFRMSVNAHQQAPQRRPPMQPLAIAFRLTLSNTVGIYSDEKRFVVYDMRRHVFPIEPSPTTTHLMSMALEAQKQGRLSRGAGRKLGPRPGELSELSIADLFRLLIFSASAGTAASGAGRASSRCSSGRAPLGPLALPAAAARAIGNVNVASVGVSHSGQAEARAEGSVAWRGDPFWEPSESFGPQDAAYLEAQRAASFLL